MPRFKDKTDAVFKRIVIVPFDADFKGSNENRKIKDEYIKINRYLNIYFIMQLTWTLKNLMFQMYLCKD